MKHIKDVDITEIINDMLRKGTKEVYHTNYTIKGEELIVQVTQIDGDLFIIRLK